MQEQQYQQQQQQPFQPFLFSFSPQMQLRVESERDIVPAISQVEYLAGTDSKVKQICADQCLKHLDNDELDQIEQSCIAHCNRKLSVFFGAYYSQNAVIQRQIAAPSAFRPLAAAAPATSAQAV